MRRRSSWILVSSLTALTAVVAIATLAAAPPNLTKALEAQRHRKPPLRVIDGGLERRNLE